jgi:hypothetical protein
MRRERRSPCVGGERVIAFVAKRKSVPSPPGEECERQLAAGAWG